MFRPRFRIMYIHQDLASDLSEIRIELSWRSNNWTVETRFSSDEKRFSAGKFDNEM